MKNYAVVRFADIEPLQCPCGTTRRAFVSPDNPTATMHLVRIAADSTVHYHRDITELYFVVAGTGHMELDGEEVPLAPQTAVLIKPGCRHRAVGDLAVLVVAVPAFDPADEWFD